MRKLLTAFLLLAITGFATACESSPLDLAGDCDGNPDPNSYCEPGG